jgi:hypothetical protein
MERIAQCQCGSLRAITAEQPTSSYVCHCLSCQRRTGTVVHAGTYLQKSNVRCEGARTIYSRPAESGFEVRFYFCPTCGTSVFWESDKFPELIGIAVGCFGDPFLSASCSISLGGEQTSLAGVTCWNREPSKGLKRGRYTHALGGALRSANNGFAFIPDEWISTV